MRSALLLALLCSCHGPQPERPEPEPTPTGPLIGTTPDFHGAVPSNLVMISIDTLRKQRLARYGDPKQHMPFLHLLMDEGFVLDDHRTCSNWTFAGVSCTLAGRYNIEAGLMPRLGEGERQKWPLDTPFLARQLRDAGFATVLASGNGWFSPDSGNALGYDRYSGRPFEDADNLYDTAIVDLLQTRRAGQPYFLHLHLMEPHAPYNPPQRYLAGEHELEPIPFQLDSKRGHYEATGKWPDSTEDLRAVLLAHLDLRYRGELEWLDFAILRILTDLDFRGLLDNALLVVWSDHGEQFWEHGYQSHAFTLHHEENDGVAFFWSRNIEPGAWSRPTVAIDLVPTLLGLYGLEVPEHVTGMALGTAPDDRPRFAATVSRLGAAQSVSQGPLKLTWSWFGIARLFDRLTDPDEQVNLYDPADPRVRTLWDLLEPMAAAAEPLVDDHEQTPPLVMP